MDLKKKGNPLSLTNNFAVEDKGIIALYGAGGKTTLLNRLGQELAGAGNKVILTTTTKIFRPAAEMPVVLESDFGAAVAALRQNFHRHDLVVLGSTFLPNGKLDGIEPGWAKELLAAGPATHILIEADGAARLPIKGYASFEPVLPREADLIIPLQGLDALGSTVEDKFIHRAALFAEATGAPPGEPLTPFHFSRSLLQMIDRGREQAPRARIIPLLNKIDLLTEPGCGLLRVLAAEPASSPAVDKILFAALQKENPIKFVLDLSSGVPTPIVSCIMLAAGSSRRMGRDKLFLPLKGKTVLGHALQNAATAGIKEVIVVTRPESCSAVEEVSERLLKGTVEGAAGETIRGSKKETPAVTAVKVIANPQHHRGISSSLQAGLAAINPLAQGVIFALGDQPFIPPEVYNLLLEHYTENLNFLTYPHYEGQRGNPALFDRRTWPALMTLAGDAGGSQLMSRLPAKEVYAVETRYPGILADLDTPEDWEKFNPEV